MGPRHQHPHSGKLHSLQVSYSTAPIPISIPVQMTEWSTPHSGFPEACVTCHEKMSCVDQIFSWDLGIERQIKVISSRSMGYKNTSRIVKKYIAEVAEWPWKLFLWPVTLWDFHPNPLLIVLFYCFFFRGGGRETSICCCTYALIGCFLYVLWLEMEPTTLVYKGDTLANWVTRLGFLIFLNMSLGHILPLTPCNACFTVGQRRKIVKLLSLNGYM